MTSWVSCFIAPNSPCEKLRAKTRENATHRNETNLRAIRTASPPPVPSLFWTREILRIFRKYRLLVLRVLSAIVHRDHNRRGSDENRPSSLLLNEREKEKLVPSNIPILSTYFFRECYEYSKSCWIFRIESSSNFYTMRLERLYALFLFVEFDVKSKLVIFRNYLRMVFLEVSFTRIERNAIFDEKLKLNLNFFETGTFFDDRPNSIRFPTELNKVFRIVTEKLEIGRKKSIDINLW